MTRAAEIIFTIALIPYVLTWVYIRQLVREVNTNAAAPHVSMLWWLRGWRLHRNLFPVSRVRKRIIRCAALTLALALTAFTIQARYMVQHISAVSSTR